MKHPCFTQDYVRFVAEEAVVLNQKQLVESIRRLNLHLKMTQKTDGGDDGYIEEEEAATTTETSQKEDWRLPMEGDASNFESLSSKPSSSVDLNFKIEESDLVKFATVGGKTWGMCGTIGQIARWLSDYVAKGWVLTEEAERCMKAVLKVYHARTKG